MKNKIPETVISIGRELKEKGFEAYLVGGSVRDFLIGREPKDWDIATNAKPEDVQAVFADTVYENKFGTVGVKTGSEDPKLKIIEVTTFRWEGKYTDRRHPDEVGFAKTIEEDLSRRDFTVNAMALDLASDDYGIIDPFGGRDDLEAKVIRTVGDPEARFNEDALRLLRAVRFATELDFEIEMGTRMAIEKLAGTLEAISKERVRDEFVKMMMTPRAAQGVIMLEELDLLRYVMPELREGLGVGQNKHHIYTVFEHNIRALEYSAGKDYSLEVRMASLLHDVGKPRSKKGEGPDSTFYNHDHIGGRMTLKILDNLKFPRDFVEHVAHLVRYHLFYYNVGEVTEAGVRRFLARVGPENISDLIKVREADRIGSGVPKAVPYKLRHLLFMIEKVKRDPISPKMLKLDGNAVMEITGMKPGPRIGYILSALLEEVLDDPAKNSVEYLSGRANELNGLSDDELKAISLKAREAKEEFESAEEGEIKRKFRV